MPASFSIGLNDNVLRPALLMEHYKNVEAFMQFSSCAAYTPTGDLMTAYTEEDAVGSKAEGFYSGTKIAGEGAIKVMAYVCKYQQFSYGSMCGMEHIATAGCLRWYT